MLIAIESEEGWREALRKAIIRSVAVMAVVIASGPAVGQEEAVSETDVALDVDVSSRPLPNVEPRRESHIDSTNYDLTDAQLSSIRKLEAFTYLWIVMLGASAGSFLNVVIYRLPAGRRLFGRSMCPGCDQQIQWKDNIPILGWVRLLGRCRNCQVRIPVRYPGVEALIGGWFALLLAVELLSGGDNLPVRAPNSYDGVVWIIWYTKWDLVGIYLFHCFLACVVIAAALIQWDGHPLPQRLTWFALWTGVIAPTVWKHLHPVSFHEPRRDWLSQEWRWQIEFTDPLSGWTQYFGVGLDGLFDSIAGLVAGLLTGWLIARCLGRGAFSETIPYEGVASAIAQVEDAEREHARGFCLLFAVVVTFLGWQSAGPLAIAVSGITVAFGLVSRITSDPRWRRHMTNTAIAAAVLIQIPLWRAFSTFDAWPDHTGWPIIANRSWWPITCEPFASLVLAIAVGCLIALTHSLISGADASSPEDGEGKAMADGETLDTHPA